MCDKIKEIKRLLDVIKITDWSEIGDRIDEIKLIFDDIEKPKRKPLPDGTLPMTESEKTELAKLIGFSVMFRAVYNSDHLCAYISPYHKPITLDNIKAILWLAERFELTSNMENNLTNGKLGGRPTIQDKWNAQADKWNQWDNLSDEEKREFKRRGRNDKR